jgi:hypothetical protein
MRHNFSWCSFLAAVLILAAMPGIPGDGSPAEVFADQPPGKTFPLVDFLNPDGSLDLRNEFNDSLDPSGWRMGYGPAGEPLFMPANYLHRLAPGTRWAAD